MRRMKPSPALLKACSRMKKHVSNVLESHGVREAHTVRKWPHHNDWHARNEELVIVIHPAHLLGHVDHTVDHALENNGIQFERRTFFLGSHLRIPIDQEACPQ